MVRLVCYVDHYLCKVSVDRWSRAGFPKRGRIALRGVILVSWWAKICKRAKVRKGAKGGRF